MSSHLSEKTLPPPIASHSTPSHKSSLLRQRVLLVFLLGSTWLFLLAFPPLSPSFGLPFFSSSISPSASLLSKDGSLPAVAWEACEGLSEKFSCAWYEVPMDYTGKEEGVVTLAVIRYATDEKKKRLGSLFVNP